MIPFKKPGPSADFEKVKGGQYLKEILILNSFPFEDKDPRFTRLKSGLALRLISKRLFYIRAIVRSPKGGFQSKGTGGFLLLQKHIPNLYPKL